MSVRVSLSARIYPRQCLEQAISAYSHVCSVEVRKQTAGGCQIDINVLEAAQSQEDQVIREFLNYLLDLSLETQLAKPL